MEISFRRQLIEEYLTSLIFQKYFLIKILPRELMGAIKSVCCYPDQNNQQTNKVLHHVRQPVKKAKQENLRKIISLQQQTKTTINQKIEQYVKVKPKYKKKISFEDFKIEGVLGQGGFGIVFLAQLKSNLEKGVTEIYALKRVTKSILIKKKLLESAKLEKNILATFQCKFIVALIMAFQNLNYVYFAMQCATGGDTYSLINKKSPKIADFKALGQKAIKFIAGCVILGLEYLHKQNIIYRDLKPQNVLMFTNGYVKITDFGLAKKTQEDQVSNTVTGTIFYFAPQMLLKKGYNMGIDFWAIGVYLYELSILQPPFQKQKIDKYRYKKVCMDAEACRNWRGALLSDQLKSLIDGLLKFNPQERLGFNGWDQVKNHEFFKDFDWKSLENQKMQSPIKQLVGKFPLKIKPFKLQATKQSNSQETSIEGWTLLKECKD